MPNTHQCQEHKSIVSGHNHYSAAKTNRMSRKVVYLYFFGRLLLFCHDIVYHVHWQTDHFSTQGQSTMPERGGISE